MDIQGKVFNSFMSGLAFIYDAFQLQAMFQNEDKVLVFIYLFFAYSY